MRNKKEKRGFYNFGFSTVLLSFVMICVVTFSALALVTAHSDYKLSRKVADKTQKYYAAQEKAYERLPELEAMLWECYEEANARSNTSSECSQTYFELFAKKAADYGTFTETSGEFYLSFEEAIAADQHLTVTLRLLCPRKDSDVFYEIVEWKSVYTREAPEDAFLDLIE